MQMVKMTLMLITLRNKFLGLISNCMEFIQFYCTEFSNMSIELSINTQPGNIIGPKDPERWS